MMNTNTDSFSLSRAASTSPVKAYGRQSVDGNENSGKPGGLPGKDVRAEKTQSHDALPHDKATTGSQDQESCLDDFTIIDMRKTRLFMKEFNERDGMSLSATTGAIGAAIGIGIAALTGIPLFIAAAVGGAVGVASGVEAIRTLINSNYNVPSCYGS